ncbi:MAG TPA: hypothetical protein VMD48_03585 [Solirubrobacteraceae bacterium]|nr:hypothetical protein [Solirubrobacteraceae bacterium]
MNPKQALPAVRFAIGAGAFAAPVLTGKAFGLSTKDNHEAVFLGRLFGIRDLALGIGQTLSSGEGNALWWQLGIVCDFGDAIAAFKMFKAGGPKVASVLAGATALSAVGLGIAALSAPASE